MYFDDYIETNAFYNNLVKHHGVFELTIIIHLSIFTEATSIFHDDFMNTSLIRPEPHKISLNIFSRPIDEIVCHEFLTY